MHRSAAAHEISVGYSLFDAGGGVLRPSQYALAGPGPGQKVQSSDGPLKP
jgi:hypothetical protein